MHRFTNIIIFLPFFHFLQLLKERVSLTTKERDRVQSRIEEIQKELESDSKVQVWNTAHKMEH